MHLRRPDPDYAGSKRAQRNFWLAVRLTAGFIAVMWSVFLFDWIAGLDLARFGLRPREGVGLLGLATTPLLHAHLAHIASNTVPLFIGGVAMLFLYPNSALKALPVMYLGSAALAWVIGRSSLHIGASGLVYAILAFVFVSGILKRDLRSVGVSLMIWFLYGSMLWGALPVNASSSWELHASGMMIGVILAFVFRDDDRPPVKRYDWEWDEEFGEELEDRHERRPGDPWP
ncbi:rhomboid family intramembrane serine protease [Wenzhouxiangella sediminis]|uniref:Rhomboid family intramembrane serine protease n=1 Tax=Wenzhouxiangella sediminis TaxID=1792836 RepID=A0A3E1KBP9_9GAMM|nr:rhomboid family intramembrane serine protease [Wenzhouxiangella sediminis]RFF31919.1 rhomboid family intramembrane serine protease [Wenzhouxiangella sediminis]